MNEVKIADAKCFVVDCGRNMAWESFGGGLFQLICPHCRYRPPKATTESGAIQKHLALCADVEKGQEWKKGNVGWVSMLKNARTQRDETQAHLDTAVGLLRWSRQCCSSIFDATAGQYKEYDSFCEGRETLLALPAIKAILKQKGQ